MNKINFKYLYGPVPSWRLGSSLGVDLLSQDSKICNFDCLYCQLGKTLFYTVRRKLYIPTEEIIGEINKLPKAEINYITFSGRGEPTLAINLGDAIRAVKNIRSEPVAVLTNSALISDKAVRRDLSYADFVVAKLDTDSQELLEVINNPSSGIKLKKIIYGLKKFCKKYTGRLALQMMFIADNKNQVDMLIQLANTIKPDEIQINTPLRPSRAKPLSEEKIAAIKKHFREQYMISYKGQPIRLVSTYDDTFYQKVQPISDKDTIRRRGKPIE